MASFFDLLRTRLIPASLTAAGIALITAGLLSYTSPVETADVDETPIVVEASPSPSQPVPSTSPSGSVPPGSPSATPAPSKFPKGRVATRVVIPGLRIDLPVVKPPGNSTTYPLCDVAMYLRDLYQPGQGRATYIYAHAREGMFLPMLDASKVNNGAGMLGMLVQVYTSDDQLFVYEVTSVRRHQTDLDRATKAKTEQLWLQTSEGFHIPQKLQVVARFVTSGPARHADAHPTPHPVVCA
jgi:sortase (surface protein transpeptidase)